MVVSLFLISNPLRRKSEKLGNIQAYFNFFALILFLSLAN
jgi:hypothetical protein